MKIKQHVITIEQYLNENRTMAEMEGAIPTWIVFLPLSPNGTVDTEDETFGAYTMAEYNDIQPYNHVANYTTSKTFKSRSAALEYEKSVKLAGPDFITNESINSKDYNRMADLILKGDRDGSTVAKSIRDKKKAMSRFVAGLKLLNKPIRLDRWQDYQKYEGPFSDLGNLALSLGATLEEIENAYNTAAVPDEVLSKMEVQGAMKLNSSSVSKISKAVIDLGCAIHYVSGNALTHEGKDWMRRNGRKWTIGYRSTITLPDGSTRKFDFDAVTCEGGGPTMYIVYYSEIGRYDTYKIYGILEFTKMIQQNLKSQQTEVHESNAYQCDNCGERAEEEELEETPGMKCGNCGARAWVPEYDDDEYYDDDDY